MLAHSSSRKCVFEHQYLTQDLGLHPSTGFVTEPQVIAKTLDHMVGGHTTVGRTIFNQLQSARQHTNNIGILFSLVWRQQLAKQNVAHTA